MNLSGAPWWWHRGSLTASNSDRQRGGRSGTSGTPRKFHTVRLPLYLLRLVGWAPAGAARVLRGVGRWVTDAQARPLRVAAIRAELFTEYKALEAQRDLRVKVRAAVLTVTIVVTWVVHVILADHVPGWLSPLALALVVLALGRYSRRG